jgi:hypothetical protein
MNYQAKIDIKKLNKAFVMPIVGKTATIEYVCIPTTEFYKGKNGELYCSMEIVERKQVGQYGDSHFVKQQLEKENYKALTEEQRKAIPILGSFQPSKFGNVETVIAEEVKPQNAPQTVTNTHSDVPF